MQTSIATAYPIPKRHPYYALFLLWLVALFRFVDLQIIAVLLESIRTEFAFTDTQLALLGGLAFALFYSTLGIPIAWLADRYSRRNIISAAVGLWSLMTALCGYAHSFATLFLFRMGVGIGEAGGYPPTTSLLSDYFPAHKRGFAFSVLGTAIPLGVFAGFLIGGIVNQYYGWRMAFLIVGFSGIGLALITLLTLKEPPRGDCDTHAPATQPPDLTDCFRHFWRIHAFRHVVLGACLFTLGAYGSGIWLPSFFMRHHGMESAEIGIWLAVIYGAGGLIGAISGGSLGDYLSRRNGDPSVYMKICSLSMIAIVPFALFVYLSPNPLPALLVQFIVATLMHMNIGPVLAMVQGLAGISRRSMGQATNVLVTNLIALPLGPLFIGLASDIFSPHFGDIALGYAILALVVISYTWSSGHFYLASRTLKQDLKIVAEEE